MKIKTSELTGVALKYAVALAEKHPAGRPPPLVARHGDELWFNIGPTGHEVYDPVAGPEGDDIIDREKISTVLTHAGTWLAHIRQNHTTACFGPDRRTAAMRSWVAYSLGDEVEVPDGLLESAP